LTLALGLTPGIGGKTIARVLARQDVLGREPGEMLTYSPEVLREEFGLTMRAAAAWHARARELVNEARGLEERLARHGVGIASAADAHFPARLEQFDPDPPGLLFYFGNARLLETRTFCVMSSRRSPPEALRLGERLAEEGVLASEVLVCGHDTPEYQAWAVVPLRWGAPRVLVLDRGLYAALGGDLSQEPFRAARLWRHEFDPKTDLALTTLAPDQAFAPSANQMRDRLIAGLSMRLDFVKVAPGGNMERLLRRGLKAGRAVRVSATSQEAEAYRAAGATVLTD
jgi:DNA processing protein